MTNLRPTRPTMVAELPQRESSIHGEEHGRGIADDAPSPTCLPQTHRRAIPEVLVFPALAPAHPGER
jgi:hypothetical protein